MSECSWKCERILVTPYAKLRRAHNRRNPEWRQRNLTVWDRRRPRHTVPACLSLQNARPRPQMTVTLSGPVTDGIRLLRSKSDTSDSIYFHSVRVSSNVVGNRQIETFNVCYHQRYDHHVPFGISEKIQWELWDSQGVTYSFSTYLELYFVSQSLSRMYGDEAVSLELLHDVVLPSLRKRFQNTEEWMDWAVSRFLTSMPDSNPYDVEKLEVIHQFRYNVFSANPSLTHVFDYDMDAWLENRTTDDYHIDKDHYNQAILVFMTLSLGFDAQYSSGVDQLLDDTGLPHHREKQSPVIEIQHNSLRSPTQETDLSACPTPSRLSMHSSYSTQSQPSTPSSSIYSARSSNASPVQTSSSRTSFSRTGSSRFSKESFGSVSDTSDVCVTPKSRPTSTTSYTSYTEDYFGIKNPRPLSLASESTQSREYRHQKRLTAIDVELDFQGFDFESLILSCKPEPTKKQPYRLILPTDQEESISIPNRGASVARSSRTSKERKSTSTKGESELDNMFDQVMRMVSQRKKNNYRHQNEADVTWAPESLC